MRTWKLSVGRWALKHSAAAFAVSERGLAFSPRLIEFRDQLPKTIVGKVLKRELLREHKEQYNGQKAEA